MCAFGKLLLNLLVKLNVAAEALNLPLLFVISLNQRLSLRALVLKLGRQLMILKDSQSRGGLELLVVESHQIGLRFFDFKVHLLLDFLDCLNLVALSVVNLNHA